MLEIGKCLPHMRGGGSGTGKTKFIASHVCPTCVGVVRGV